MKTSLHYKVVFLLVMLLLLINMQNIGTPLLHYLVHGQTIRIPAGVSIKEFFYHSIYIAMPFLAMITASFLIYRRFLVEGAGAMLALFAVCVLVWHFIAPAGWYSRGYTLNALLSHLFYYLLPYTLAVVIGYMGGVLRYREDGKESQEEGDFTTLKLLAVFFVIEAAYLYTFKQLGSGGGYRSSYYSGPTEVVYLSEVLTQSSVMLGALFIGALYLSAASHARVWQILFLSLLSSSLLFQFPVSVSFDSPNMMTYILTIAANYFLPAFVASSVGYGLGLTIK